MRLACRQWADRLPRPKPATAQHLPVEILLAIYGNLSPCDYDAARHTCRFWFLVGLDLNLASTMLKKCGAYPAFLQDVELESTKFGNERTSSTSPARTTDQIDRRWLMAKRLATEARLSPSCRRSGISNIQRRGTTDFAVVEHVDFRKLLEPTSKDASQASRAPHFTVSSCSKYLLLIVGREVFIYSFTRLEASLEPIVRLIAQQRVICVSMDTTSGRYAVAALLEGRLGLSWDLRSVVAPQDNTIVTLGESMDLGMRTDVQGLTNLGASKPIPMRMLSRSTSGSTGESNSPIENHEAVQNLHGVVSCLTESPEDTSPILTGSLSFTDDLESVAELKTSLPGPVAIVTRPTGVYPSLGTGGDSPRSVAICPQRKCIAFGCRSGIELHWIDTTTGSSLNRWFPLAAPSDHLFFLPQRPGIDTMKKLRLISSATGPSRYSRARRESVPTKWTLRSSNPRYHGRLQSMTRLFFGSLPFPSALTRSNTRRMSEEDDQGVLRTVDCDHYRAVPISDGAHILFTDPATGLLCLGSDAPLGGPTKLMRKVCMVPPSSDEPENASALTCYRAGDDLRWGVRIVAAYDDGQVVLYNLSADCFNRIRYIRSSPDVWDELGGVLGQSDLLMDVFMTSYQPEGTTDNSHHIYEYGSNSRRASISSTSSRSFRSLQIDGVVVWRAKAEIEDLRVDCSNGGCKIWIFLHDGQATKLDIYVPKSSAPLHRYVGIDGLIHDSDRQAEHGCPSRKGKSRANSFETTPARDEHRMVTKPGQVKFEV